MADDIIIPPDDDNEAYIGGESDQPESEPEEDLHKRIRRITLSGGIKDERLPVYYVRGEDWRTVFSDNPFERLYLDWEQTGQITDDMIRQHARMFRRHWERLIEVYDGGTGSPADKDEMLRRYGGRLSTFRSLPQDIESAASRLHTAADRTREAEILRKEQDKKNEADKEAAGQRILAGLTVTTRSDGELDSGEAEAILESAVDVDAGLNRESIAGILLAELKKRGYESVDEPDPTNNVSQLLSTAWRDPDHGGGRIEEDEAQNHFRERLNRDFPLHHLTPDNTRDLLDKAQDLGVRLSVAAGLILSTLKERNFRPAPGQEIAGEDEMSQLRSITWVSPEEYRDLAREAEEHESQQEAATQRVTSTRHREAERHSSKSVLRSTTVAQPERRERRYGWTLLIVALASVGMLILINTVDIPWPPSELVAEVPPTFTLSDLQTNSLRFFETDIKAVPPNQRKYQTRFPKSAARYISWELNLTYPRLDKQSVFPIEAIVRNTRDGVLARDTTEIILEADGTSSYVSDRWEQQASWPSDTYTVELYIKGSQVASESFEIYEDQAPSQEQKPNDTGKDPVITETPVPDIFVATDPMPEPIGGLAGIQEKIRYPEAARRAGVEGRVIVQFIVDEQGNVQDATVTRGIGAGCDEEAVRVVRQARFQPRRKAGKPVKVKMSLSIPFELPKTEEPDDTEINPTTLSFNPNASATGNHRGDRFTITVLSGQATAMPDGRTKLTLQIRQTSENFDGRWDSWLRMLRESSLITRGQRNYKVHIQESEGLSNGPARPGESREGTVVFYVDEPISDLDRVTLHFAFYAELQIARQFVDISFSVR